MEYIFFSGLDIEDLVLEEMSIYNVLYEQISKQISENEDKLKQLVVQQYAYPRDSALKVIKERIVDNHETLYKLIEEDMDNRIKVYYNAVRLLDKLLKKYEYEIDLKYFPVFFEKRKSKKSGSKLTFSNAELPELGEKCWSGLEPILLEILMRCMNSLDDESLLIENLLQEDSERTDTNLLFYSTNNKEKRIFFESLKSAIHVFMEIVEEIVTMNLDDVDWSEYSDVLLDEYMLLEDILIDDNGREDLELQFEYFFNACVAILFLESETNRGINLKIPKGELRQFIEINNYIDS